VGADAEFTIFDLDSGESVHDTTSSKALEQRSHMQFVNRLPRIAAALLLAVVVPWVAALPSNAHPPDDDHTHIEPTPITHNRPEHGGLGDIGAKLADPTANIWALTFNVQGPEFYDGDLNTGSPQVGGNVIFEPVMPFPLYGTGKNQWKMITRPVIPIIFSEPIPTGVGTDSFNHIGGLGDIELPLLLALPERMLGHWIFAAGPVFEFPSATNAALGANQYSVGPAVAFGYKTKRWVGVLFPNYFFGVGSQSDRTAADATTSKLSLLYAFTYNLPKAWQVGFNPTISYNHTASSGNQWDVPVGLFASKVVEIAGVPTKIQATVEYSVVSPDAFGKRASFRFVITPVIPGLVSKPIFGGK
jgi:hypothetical protein